VDYSDLFMHDLATQPFKQAQISENHAIAEAVDFDDDTCRSMMAMINSDPAKDIQGHIKI